MLVISFFTPQTPVDCYYVFHLALPTPQTRPSHTSHLSFPHLTLILPTPHSSFTTDSPFPHLTLTSTVRSSIPHRTHPPHTTDIWVFSNLFHIFKSLCSSFLVHPIVRVFLVDLTTGVFLKKSDFKKKVLYFQVFLHQDSLYVDTANWQFIELLILIRW
jgi:hypothetical protein